MKFSKQAPAAALLIAFLAPPAVAESDRERIKRIMAELSAAEADRQALAKRRRERIMAEYSAAEADRDRQALANRRRAVAAMQEPIDYWSDDQWRLFAVPDPGGPTNLNTTTHGDPTDASSPGLKLYCSLYQTSDKWGERSKEHNLLFVVTFKNVRFTVDSTKKDRVQLQLGFWGAIESEDGGYQLRQELIDYDEKKRSWAYKPYRSAGGMRYPREERGLARLFYHEAADVARRIYRSEFVSWTNRRNGETYNVEVGEKGRNSIEQVMNLCGFSVHESP